MKKETILVTGGAGFIGGHLCEKLYDKGYDIIVYDNLSEQIHGKDAELPSYLKNKVKFIKGDIRDREKLKNAILESDKIVHLVAETGVGQSMYEIDRYFSVTVQGTAVLWDILANEKHNVKKVVLSSSRAVYGEGKYNCEKCGVVYPTGRTEAQLSKHDWEPKCPYCGKDLSVLPANEKDILNPTSIYAINKRTQEDIFAVMGKALNIPYSIVRYQNVYGPRQSLNNPYTGILSIFASRLKNGNKIMVYEDGAESRDFSHVLDVVQGTTLALEKDEANFQIFNIANGKRTSVMEIAQLLTSLIDPNNIPEIVYKYRVGDIRHCYADISKAEKLLGYSPNFNFKSGIEDFYNWSKNEEAIDNSLKAEAELRSKGMFK